MKKIFKSRLFLVIIAVILTGTVGVFAEDILEATGIKYKNKSVEDSLNELYIKANAKDVGALKFCKFIDGTYGSFGEIGSKYECDPGDGVTRNFYLLAKNNDNSVDLIMDRNITGDYANMDWNGAMNYIATSNLKSIWSNVIDVDLPKAQDIANAIGYNVIVTSQYSDVKICVNDLSTDVCPQTTNSKNAWLYNYTSNCAVNGCDSETSLNNDTNTGYWTRDLFYDRKWAYCVNNSGVFFNNTVSSQTNGVRPVITILKTNLYSE